MIVIGDVHGNFKTMEALLNKIPKEERDKGVAFVGDLIDRGPMSADIVEFVRTTPWAQTVRGNHEQMMIDEGLKEASYFMRHGHVNTIGKLDGYGGRSKPSLWVVNGGKETIESYADIDEDGNRIFDMDSFLDHIEWMKTLPLYLEFKDVKNNKGDHLLVTHSSAGAVWEWDAQRRKEQSKQFTSHLIWGRPHQYKPIGNIYNIFGHTPVAHGPRIKSFYANIDTGAFYNSESGYFKLTALQFPEMIVYEQENIDAIRYR